MQFFKRFFSPVNLAAIFLVIVFQSGLAQKTTSLILKGNSTDKPVFLYDLVSIRACSKNNYFNPSRKLD